MKLRTAFVRPGNTTRQIAFVRVNTSRVVKTSWLLGCLVGLGFIASSAGAQQQTVPRYAQRGLGRFVYQTLNDTSSAASSRVLVFPTAGFSPETSLEIGVRVFSLYYAKDDTSVNRLSEIVLYSFVTLRGQFGAQLENAIYSDRNTYYLLNPNGNHRSSACAASRFLSRYRPR